MSLGAYGACPGTRIAAAAAAYPGEVHGGAALPGASFANRDACRELYGGSWEAELERRGFDLAHFERERGVLARGWLAPPGQTQDGELPLERLASGAARLALARAGGAAVDVDVLIAATSTPERATSALASAVASVLGLECACFDVRAGGAAALLALISACAWLAQGARAALIVAAEVPSRWIDPREPGMALLYGDGAAAVVLARGGRADEGLAAARALHARVPGRAFTVPGPLPPTRAAVEQGSYAMSKPDRAYVERLAELRLELAAALRPGVPTLALPYAVSRAEAESIARALGLGPQAAVTELERRGVLGCAAPLASLAALASRGGLAQGDRLALLAVGGGVEAAGIVWAT